MLDWHSCQICYPLEIKLLLLLLTLLKVGRVTSSLIISNCIMDKGLWLRGEFYVHSGCPSAYVCSSSLFRDKGW